MVFGGKRSATSTAYKVWFPIFRMEKLNIKSIGIKSNNTIEIMVQFALLRKAVKSNDGNDAIFFC